MDEAKALMEESEGYIPGAINIPLSDINENVVSSLPDKSQMILVYCRSGNRSRQASDKLSRLGYTNIIEIGGINSWKGEIIKID